MNTDHLKSLLEDLARGKTTVNTVMEKLKTLPYEDLGFANVDHHRTLRSGFPEVVYCEGKTPAQILSIINNISKKKQDVLATRLDEPVYKKIKNKLPAKTAYHSPARALVIQHKKKKLIGRVLVLSAGTSDIPVAEEAAVTLQTLGSKVDRIFDVGVAGLHRLLDRLEIIREARVLVVVAGMDGALASVVGGLVDSPVIGVPTSIGYGTAFEGVAPLLTMLNSCAPGVGTVNIDNGFGAGVLAHRINQSGEPSANQ